MQEKTVPISPKCGMMSKIVLCHEIPYLAIEFYIMLQRHLRDMPSRIVTHVDAYIYILINDTSYTIQHDKINLYEAKISMYIPAGSYKRMAKGHKI